MEEISKEELQNNPAETDNTTENQPLTSDKEKCEEKDRIIKDWKEEYDQLYEKYIRLYSEFENFRRRTTKEKSELVYFANTNLILEILPVIDDFERALTIMDKAEDVKQVKEGVDLIYSKFKKTLGEKGLKEIDCVHKEFDPELHDAITKIPAPSKKLKGKIVDQIQKGYFLNDKVIRHSKVVIGE